MEYHDSSRGNDRILYFSNCNNYHTYKWANYFSSEGYEIHIASLEKPKEGNAGELPGVNVHWLSNKSSRLGSELQKLSYLQTIGQAKELIEKINPDIVHAHYASSYGTICAEACRRPYYLSVWGNDIYDFPKKGLLHRAIVQRALSKCTWLMSTSNAMAAETHKYTAKYIYVTPFGVDMNLFNPNKAKSHEGFVVGTVKGLEKKYGIEEMLRACKIVHDQRPDIDLRVRIAGKGTLEGYLHDVATKLGMDGYLQWLGFISQEQAASEWASFDVALVPSESESFGVSAVEAQACGTPLVISDAPGLMEACNNGKDVLVVHRGDIIALANAIERLADDASLRASNSKGALNYVRQAYEYSICFDRIKSIYEKNGSARLD